jgi:1,4-dihydroxy-2-naphthoyl-CoA hydrolase
MGIWFTQATVDELTAWGRGTMVEHLGIEYLKVGKDTIRARMPVDRRTVQPARILHGGASVTLAETLGSVAAFLCVDPTVKRPVGLAINANHVRPASSGYVMGTARPIHIGRSTHLWEVRIENEEGKLVCIARLTAAILDLGRASPELSQRRGESREEARSRGEDGVRYAVADETTLQLITEQWGEKVANHLHVHDGFTMVAWVEGAPAGLISTKWQELPGPMKRFVEGYIDIIEVAAGFRRQGIAKKLVELTSARARERGAYQLRAWSSEDKVEAIPMWKELGFGLGPAELFSGGEKVSGFFATRVLE